MLVILPFEKEFYKKWNYEVEYVGHPLVEVVDEFLKSSIQYPESSIESSIQFQLPYQVTSLPFSPAAGNRRS